MDFLNVTPIILGAIYYFLAVTLYRIDPWLTFWFLGWTIIFLYVSIVDTTFDKYRRYLPMSIFT